MKKNIVGHMMAPKVSKKTLWKRLDLIPRLLCLLLALLVWLLVANAKNDEKPADNGADQVVAWETVV